MYFEYYAAIVTSGSDQHHEHWVRLLALTRESAKEEAIALLGAPAGPTQELQIAAVNDVGPELFVVSILVGGEWIDDPD